MRGLEFWKRTINEMRTRLNAKRNARIKALWLAIECIECFNDDVDETVRSVDILKEIIREEEL